MKLSFKNRIAFSYILVTAVVIALTFLSIFLLVRNTIFSNIDSDLNFEIAKHREEITVTSDSIYFTNKKELEEREHMEVQVNPVFIQITDTSGKILDKSPNLKENILAVIPEQTENTHFNATLADQNIRLAQIPIARNGKIQGFMISALSIDSALLLIRKLEWTLFILYPIILLLLFFLSRYLAGRSISPIKEIIQTTNRITRENLRERVSLPPKKDELYELSSAINGLMARIEAVLERERAFTSDASHELRTPLTSLRGTLEVLVRKERTREEYENKVQYSLSVIDSMTQTIEKLLILARIEQGKRPKNEKLIPLNSVVENSLLTYQKEIGEKDLDINFSSKIDGFTKVPEYYAQLIIDNILSNAIKYSRCSSQIYIDLKKEAYGAICTIQDYGVGIEESDLENIFTSFFRSKSMDHREVQGNGLGLSIVKKAADEIEAKIEVESKPGRGTTFRIHFLSQS